MKKTRKSTFFVVVILIALFAVSSVLGVDKRFADKTTTYVKGVDDIRLGIDIKGGVDVTFAPAGDYDADTAQLDSATEIIKTRLTALGITDNEARPSGPRWEGAPSTYRSHLRSRGEAVQLRRASLHMGLGSDWPCAKAAASTG